MYPGLKENRIFKYTNKLHYDSRTHRRTIPFGLSDKNTILYGKILHFKIQTANIEDYVSEDSANKPNTSHWASLKTHYPDGHIINEDIDFFLDKPAGKYKGQKVFTVNMDEWLLE